MTICEGNFVTAATTSQLFVGLLGFQLLLKETDQTFGQVAEKSEADYQSFKQVLDLPQDINLLPGPNADLATLLPGDAPPQLFLQMLFCLAVSYGGCMCTMQGLSDSSEPV